jgi:LDH2 family malate/lactate/ureidoglycolate dehydrogenase
MTEKTYYILIDTLRSFIMDTFLKHLVPADDAEICADVIITSDLRGIESHGIGRLRYYLSRIKPSQHQVITKPEIIRESPTTAVIDGHHGLGMVISKQAMQMAIDKARKYGMGSVAVRNSNHFGIAGYYPLMAVAQGMIGLTVTNARPSICPTFGTEPMLGTNPIAFGAPTDEPFPFLYDAATSIVQRGKIETLARQEKSAYNGWLVDPQNNYLTDPNQILASLPDGNAAFLPLGGSGEILGGHKGYGLATMVEILSASLQTGAFLRNLTGVSEDGKSKPFRVGHFFMAINIESFTSLDNFKTTTGQILRELRTSRKAPSQDRIYTAGEKEYEKEKEVREKGVPVIPNLQKDLIFLIEKLGLDQYKFPFTLKSSP